MLLRFTVENTLSFNSEATISLVATADRSHPSHVRIAKDQRRPAALRVAAVYGANGHGKSKLVESIIALQRHIRGKPWRSTPFKLDPEAESKPTRVILEFRHNDSDFEYGTVIYDDHVAEEWLFVTRAENREEKVFERVTQKLSDDKFKTVVQPGRVLSNLPSPADDVKMSTFLKVLGTGLKPNHSFMPEAEDRDLGVMSEAFNWFDDVLTPVSATSSYSPLFERLTGEESFRDFIGDYISRCDVGIERIESQATKLDPKFFDSMPKSLKYDVDKLENSSSINFGIDDGASMQLAKNEDGEVFVRDITSIRRSATGEVVEFNLDEESSGTRRLFDLLPMIDTDGNNRVYVVDELDRKLHPLLSFQFVQSFINSSSLQMIFTTHNTHLMSLDLLRRDEIWFVQKRPDGSSDLYALSEMKIRNDLNIRKGYISGRFGAIPFIGNTEDLGWSGKVEGVHGTHQ